MCFFVAAGEPVLPHLLHVHHGVPGDLPAVLQRLGVHGRPGDGGHWHTRLHHLRRLEQQAQGHHEMGR